MDRCAQMPRRDPRETAMRQTLASALLFIGFASQRALAQTTTAHEPDVGSGSGGLASWWWVALIVVLAAILIFVLMRAYQRR